MNYLWKWIDAFLTTAIRSEGQTAVYVTMKHDDEKMQYRYDMENVKDRAQLCGLMSEKGRNSGYVLQFVQMCKRAGWSTEIPENQSPWVTLSGRDIDIRSLGL